MLIAICLTCGRPVTTEGEPFDVEVHVIHGNRFNVTKHRSCNTNSDHSKDGPSNLAKP